MASNVVATDDGDVQLQFEMQGPSDKAKAVALEELRETEENKAQGILELKKLLAELPEINCPKDDEEWLVQFLRPCKFHAESARDLIKRHFAFKKKHANIYDNLLPSREENVFTHNMITVLRGRDQLGRRILLIELGKKWNHKEVCLDEVFKAAVLFLDIFIKEPDTQIFGVVVIFDMDGLSIKQTMQFTPSFAKRIVDWLQESIPVRIKAVHIINQPKIFKVVWALFQQFLREKLRARVYFHGTNLESLHAHVSSKGLPACYGGLDDTQYVDWYNLLLEYEDEYKKVNTYGLRGPN